MPPEQMKRRKETCVTTVTIRQIGTRRSAHGDAAPDRCLIEGVRFGAPAIGPPTKYIVGMMIDSMVAHMKLQGCVPWQNQAT